MNVSTANRACSFGAINVLAFSQETLGEMRARCMLKENVENKLNMTREDQIAIASCAYGNRGSSIDFEAGARWADRNPKSPWISIKDDLPCNHGEMIKVSIDNIELNTDRVLVMLYDGTMDISFMFKPIPHSWRWNETLEITHWMPIPKLKED